MLIQKFGLLGVALGTLIAQLLTNNWYVSFVSLRVLKIPFADYSARVLFPIGGILFASLGANGVARYCLKNTSDSAAIAIGFPLVTMTCVFFAAIFIMTDEEKKVLLTFLRKRINTIY